MAGGEGRLVLEERASRCGVVATPDDASGLGLLLVPDLVDAGRSRGEESSSDKDLHHLDKVSLGLCDFTPPVCMIHQFIIGIKQR